MLFFVFFQKETKQLNVRSWMGWLEKKNESQPTRHIEPKTKQQIVQAFYAHVFGRHKCETNPPILLCIAFSSSIATVLILWPQLNLFLLPHFSFLTLESSLKGPAMKRAVFQLRRQPKCLKVIFTLLLNQISIPKEGKHMKALWHPCRTWKDLFSIRDCFIQCALMIYFFIMNPETGW